MGYGKVFEHGLCLIDISQLLTDELKLCNDVGSIAGRKVLRFPGNLYIT
jgi:hypothetical protein